MNYWARIGGALAVSLVINLALLALLPHLVRQQVAAARTDTAERAIRLDFRPPEPEQEPPKRLIDAGADAEQPVAETDLISSRDTQAQDNSDAPGDMNKPAVDQIDDFDELGHPATPEPEQPAEPAPPTPEPQPESESQTSAAEPPSPAQPAQSSVTLAQESPKEPSPLAAPKPEEPPREKVAKVQLEELTPSEAQPERTKVAQATPPPPASMPVQELKSSRAREQGESLNSGFTSFEANKHALGEYMLQVRARVEREWRTSLRLRYTGVSRTEALIECSIRPDGSLEYARVVDAGSSLTYAVICRQAIEQAAPFGPFPFDVPQIYRTQNLEITWKFSYL